MNTKLILLIFLTFNFLSIGFAGGKRDQKFYQKILSPQTLNFQYAGNTGLGSMGIGYLSRDGKKKLGLSYGYLPKSINGVKVHTLSAKGDIHLAQLRIVGSVYLNGYTGSNFIYSITNNTFAILPSYYLDNYYLPNAFHFAPFIGIKFGNSLTHNILVKGIYFELGTLDYYLLNSLKHSFRHFSQSWNLCVGITLPLFSNQ